MNPVKAAFAAKPSSSGSRQAVLKAAQAPSSPRHGKLIALEDQQGVATVPLAETLPGRPEPIEAIENEGEFPT